MTFDGELSKKNLLEFSIPYEMSEKFDPSRPMGNAARSKVYIVVMAAFIGEFDSAKGMLPRAREWLSGAIEQGEDLGKASGFISTNSQRHLQSRSGWTLATEEPYAGGRRSNSSCLWPSTLRESIRRAI
jgi:hypothetical protein